MKKQIKVAYFPSNTPKNKVIGSNGKSLDKYCIKCETEEDLSTGNYILDATFLVEDDLIDLLQEEVILKVSMDYGDEVFRISKVIAGTRYIDIVARQITIADSLTLWLEDVRPTNQTGSSAANYLIANATGTKEIQVISDIQTTSTAYYMRMSLYKALHDGDNCFQGRWGGEVLRRGYTEYINARIGIDRGFSIREGKNLTGFEVNSNIDTLITRARGQGFDGILGNYIDSPLINSYNRIYTDVIKYDDVKVKDENSGEGYDTLEQAQAELDRRVHEEYSKNDIDKIKATYTINFVQLEKTQEYKDYVVTEKAYLGDTIRVYIPKLNTDIEVRAIAKKYDVLAQRTKEVILSNYIEVKALSLKQIINRLDSIDSTESILQQAKDNATLMIKSGLKNSYVIVRENEIIIGDTKDINTMVKVWRWNNGGLGYSSTGYYGTYSTAITADGKIVATFITTGYLLADRIQGGTLTLGGANNVNGVAKVLDSTGTEITQLNKDGIAIAGKPIVISANYSYNTSTGYTVNQNKKVELGLNNLNIIDKQDNTGGEYWTKSIDYKDGGITLSHLHLGGATTDWVNNAKIYVGPFKMVGSVERQNGYSQISFNNGLIICSDTDFSKRITFTTDGQIDMGTSNIKLENVIVPTMVNGFTSTNASVHQPAGYYKDCFGIVHLQGSLYSPSSGSGLTIFTLPAGYRPSKIIFFFALKADSGTARIQVNSDGRVILEGGNNSQPISLDGINFRV